MCKKLAYLIPFVLLLSLVLSSVANAALPGCIGWYKLDEMSGKTCFDSSGLGNDGHFGSEATCTPQWVAGHYGGAVQLDGSDDYIEVNSIANDITTNNFSVLIWIKTTQTGSNHVVIGANYGGGSSHDFIFGLTNNNMLVECDTVREYPPKINDNQWHHIVYTRNLTTAYLYTDGVLIGTETPSGGDVSRHDRWSIGQEWDSSPSDEFNGTVDDILFFNRHLTIDEVQQVMQGAPPATAMNPSPADDAIDVPRDVILSWTPGTFADKHNVYFGTIFNDVNEASITNPRGVLASSNQAASTYAPAGLLDFGKTYYWRVDEVNAPPTSNTIFKGDTWQFTVEPYAYPIVNIIATASSQFSASTGPQNTINGSGLDAGDLHSTEESAIWLSSMTGAQPTWIQFEFDKVYKLQQMLVWNFNQVFEPVVGFGFKDVTLEYSTNGTDWTVLANVPQFARAPGAAGYANNTTLDLSSVTAKYIKLTANSNWGGVLPQYGLSEVRFFYVPVVAREPNPASGTTDVPLGTIGAPADVTLSFRAGREAAKHNVYFSDSSQAVIDGTAPVTTVSQASHGPLSPDLGKTYYWRVDEVNDAKTPTTWQGELWDFTTQQYFVVDDFEDYNDFAPDRIFDTWLDGWADPANGSQVGYAEPPFAEKTAIHGGKQAMPLNYDNTAGVAYSEAERTFASPQDWTVRGAKVLTLWFKGNPVAFLESPPGTFTMGADGVDIWGTADEFRFAYKQLTGDGSIIATVESILWVTGSSDWSKGGVMIRETLEAGAKNAFIALSTGAGNGATFQWRPTASAASSSARTLTGISPPSAVKLVRQGNTFTGYVFLNGQWQQEGTPATVAMGSAVYIGLALTSHSTGVMTVAKFSNVSTTGNVTGVWQVAEIGGTHPANNPAPLYVSLTDSANKTATVKHSEPAATNIAMWSGWNIDLAQFTGVNPRSIKKMIIGVGDKLNPQSAKGLVYIDDIQLYRLAPAYTVRIATGSDDAEEHVANGNMDITSTDLELAYEDAGTPATDEQVIGLRFANVGLPKGALVTGAYLEFEVDAVDKAGSANPVNLVIEGQLTPNAATFTTTSKDITNRTSLTTAKVSWSIPPWTKVDEKFRTPDISSIIQEIVNQAGWARGNSLVLLVRDDKANPSTGLREAESYEGEASAAPLLCITSQ